MKRKEQQSNSLTCSIGEIRTTGSQV